MIERDEGIGRSAIARLCESKFSVAYTVYPRNAGVIASHQSLSGPMEVILLDIDPKVQQSDSRFVLCGGGLDWAGFESTIGDQTIDVQFFLTEFITDPSETRPFEALTPEDLTFIQIYMISPDSLVASTDFGVLDDVSVGELFSKVEPTRVVTHLPDWAR